MAKSNAEIMKGQQCPICSKKTLTLAQEEMDIPFFGKTFVFSMNCSSCGYKESDVESSEKKEPSKYTLEITSDKDMNIRIIRSSTGTIKIPHVATIEPKTNAEGYITNIEGVLERIKTQVEHIRDNSEDDEEKTKAKNLVKKITRIIWGQEKAKIILEDTAGNSAIISDKAVKEKL